MIGYIAFGIAIIGILLVAFNIIKSRFYPLLIYVTALLILYSTTLNGLSVVGSDISSELLMSNLALKNGWNLTLLDPSNTSWVVGWLIPSISRITSIEPQWIYKIFLPMIFAFTPVILYLIFRKQFNEIKAYYASLFFIIMPVFSLEIATIGKSMVAETLMVLTIWTMFTNWKSWQKLSLMLPLTVLTLWAHYTIGIVLVVFLSIVLAVMLVTKLFKKWDLWTKRTISLWVLATVIIVSSVSFVFYYGNVAKGLIMYSVAGIAGSEIFKMHTPEELKELETSGALRTMNTDPLIKIGIGKDFMDASPLGKVFRIIQYLTQIMIVAGCAYLFFNHSGINAEYIALAYSALIMLGICIFLPSFASLLNMSRWYHVALMFLSPMFVYGVEITQKILGKLNWVEIRA